MSDIVDVAIVGAGPYGLSIAAHLRPSGVRVRQFGLTMHLWRATMPRGMFLKSQGFASNISDPEGSHTLAAFCKLTDRAYAGYGLPVPLETFIAYGDWFAAERATDLEQVTVTGLIRHDGCFEVTTATGETVVARQVVVAVGVEPFGHVPAPLSGLPASACTHSGQHTDLTPFADRDVVVVGGGQSALETAALLHETGARVQLVIRAPQVRWNGPPLPPDRPLLQRLREPEAGLGSGLGTWFYSNCPDLFRRLPQRTRLNRARTALGPAGASWLRERVEGQFPVRTGYQVRSADVDAGTVRLGLAETGGPSRQGPGGSRELTADHVVAATGYRTDLTRLPFLDDGLRAALRTQAGSPVVDADYASSVPGLYFAGPAVAPTFGPVMRFVYGADHAARTVAARLAATASPRRTVPVGAAR